MTHRWVHRAIVRSGLATALGLVAAAPATAAPMWGGPQWLDQADAQVGLGFTAHPVNGYGGDIAPRLGVGAKVRRIDLRASADADVPVYHRDDGALYWGYATSPSLSTLELSGRWSDQPWAPGLRVTGDSTDEWGVGVDFTRTWSLKRSTLSVRPGVTLLPQILVTGDHLGTYGGELALNRPLTDRVALIGGLTPSLMIGKGPPSSEGGAAIPLVIPDLHARGGAWFAVGTGHGLGLALDYAVGTLDGVKGVGISAWFRAVI